MTFWTIGIPFGNKACKTKKLDLLASALGGMVFAPKSRGQGCLSFKGATLMGAGLQGNQRGTKQKGWISCHFSRELEDTTESDR